MKLTQKEIRWLKAFISMHEDKAKMNGDTK